MICRRLSLLTFLLFFSFSVFSQIGKKEKFVTLQKNFNSTNNGGPTWNQFGDLVFEKNNKTYWLSTFCSVLDIAEDYFRLFEIDYSTGSFKEVTNEMLGGFYPTNGTFNPPYYYVDIDNDGIRDILIFDHGKELASIPPNEWGGKNLFFKGDINGFKKLEIPNITTVKKYFHAHSVDDFDRDGDIDIAYGGDVNKIFLNDGKGNFSEQKILNLEASGQYLINNQKYNSGTFGMKFTNIDEDKELELIVTISEQPIFLDYSPNGWIAKLFGKKDSFIWKQNIHIGVEQTLEIPNLTTQKNDLFYRVATYDNLPEDNSKMIWMTKMFMSKSVKSDSVYFVQNDLSKNNSFYFLDPKVVDLNFDGAPDLFFKEDEFWGNTGQKLHAINQRMWLNDGNNNFNPSNLKFADEANQLVYTLAKVDSVKKLNIMFSQRATPYDKSGNFTQDIRYLYTRLDTIVYPIVQNASVKLCNGTTLKTTVSKVPTGISILDNSNAKNESIIGTDYIQLKANVPGEGILRYKFKNDFFEGDINSIKYAVIDRPTTPVISREGTDLISSNVTGNQWYLDGAKLVGENNVKIKANSTGVYTVQSSNTNGCLSDFSKGEYGLITSTTLETGLNSYPNPFLNNITITFPLEYGKSADVKIVDNKGSLRYQKLNVVNGETLDVSTLPIGSYMLTIVSNFSGLSNTIKIIKAQ